MFFIDNDHGKTGQGHEKCRAGANDDLNPSRRCRCPDAQTLGVALCRVQGGYAMLAKTRLAAFYELGGEADLRDQNEGL